MAAAHWQRNRHLLQRGSSESCPLPFPADPSGEHLSLALTQMASLEGQKSSIALTPGVCALSFITRLCSGLCDATSDTV